MATDDPRLNQLITQGDDGDLVIVGCPYDFLRKRSANKGGEDNGPCCLRRFYAKVGPLVNAEYEIDISKLKVTDMGNIKIQTTQEEQEQFKNVESKRFKGQFVNFYKQSPQKIIERASDRLMSLMKNSQFPIVLGGSKQAMVASIDAFHQTFGHDSVKKVYILSGKPFLDRLYDGNKATSENVCTFLGCRYPITDFHVFGVHTKYFPSQFVEPNCGSSNPKLPKFRFTRYEEIRKSGSGSINGKLGRRTQALQKFMQIYRADELACVSISLEVLELFMGCRDVSVQGITFEEFMEIMMFLGSQNNLKCLSICEFNPSCQDYESSLLILNGLYYFLLGRALSNSQDE